jgi:hypothetical protein
MASFLHPFFLSLSYPVKFLSSPSSSPVSLCPLDTNATRLVRSSIVSFVADFAKPNAGRNIYQIDPWQCKESNGTPIENSSRRSFSTVVSTTNRQPCVCVCVCVCDFFKLLRHKLYDIFLFFSFFASIFNACLCIAGTAAVATALLLDVLFRARFPSQGVHPAFSWVT